MSPHAPGTWTLFRCGGGERLGDVGAIGKGVLVAVGIEPRSVRRHGDNQGARARDDSKGGMPSPKRRNSEGLLRAPGADRRRNRGSCGAGQSYRSARGSSWATGALNTTSGLTGFRRQHGRWRTGQGGRHLLSAPTTALPHLIRLFPNRHCGGRDPARTSSPRTGLWRARVLRDTWWFSFRTSGLSR